MICRPILLHNEFMPAKPGIRHWGYRMFGHYDGMTQGESFLIENSSSLQNIFDIYVRYENACEHPYFTQFLFGFHPDKDKDKEFWKTDYSFTYIVLLQFCKKDIKRYREYLESEEYLRRQIDLPGEQERADEIKIIAYYSMCNSDLILTIKCNSCKLGSLLIDRLRNNAEENPFELSNSYTMLAISIEDIDNMENKEIASAYKETVDYIELRAVEKDYGSVSNLYQRIKNELQIPDDKIHHNLLFGTEDEAIVIQDIAWKDILPYYSSETGILSNSNSISQDYANAISTKVLFSLKEKEITAKEVNIENNRQSALLYTRICKTIKETYKNRKDGESLAEKKNLLMLANALQRFEYSGHAKRAFIDYNFYPMLLPFYMFIRLIKEHGGDFSLSYYDFMKGMKLCTQNFAKPDRVYSQIADFNLRYFEVPAKFVTIYSAYIYFLKKGLNTNKECEYEFLVCPGVNSKAEVKEILARVSDHKRLFMVEIPEQQIYDPKNMFFILGHETAHFVGREIRQRKARYEMIARICSYAISRSVKSYFAYVSGKEKIPENNENWNQLEGKLENWVKFYMENSYNEEYLRNYYYDDMPEERLSANCSFNKTFHEYTDVLQKNLTIFLEDMLLNRGVNIFGFVIGEGIDERMDSAERNQYYQRQEEWLRECIYSFTRKSDVRNSFLTLSLVLDKLMYLIKECYADMICILALELSPDDYLSTFIDTFTASGREPSLLIDTIVLPRIALVLAALSYKMDKDGNGEEGFCWKNEDLDKIKDGNAKKLERKAQGFCAQYLKVNMTEKHVGISPHKMVQNGMNIVYDTQILRGILEYLLKCRRAYRKFKFSKIQIESIGHARRFYQTAKMQEPDQFFVVMMELLDEHEKSVYRDISDIVQAE